MAFNNFVNPSLKQIANTSFATEEDVPLILNMHKDLAKCREQTIKGFADVNPGAIPILVQGYQEQDAALADLINHKITFGEAVKRRAAIIANSVGKLQAQGRLIGC